MAQATNTFFDVTWLQGASGQPQVVIDASQAAVSVPRRILGYRSCSFQAFDPTSQGGDNGNIKGTFTVEVSNAPVKLDKLVEPAFWVPSPDLTLELTGDEALPTIQQLLFVAVGWLRLRWTPASAQGSLGARFDGPRY